jgi:hypothetical protein
MYIYLYIYIYVCIYTQSSVNHEFIELLHLHIYICIYIDVYLYIYRCMYLRIRESYFLRMECMLNMKFIHVSYILHTHCLNEIILYTIFYSYNFILWDVCTCSIMSKLKKIQILCILNFGCWIKNT